ncbi:unnamed protein product [Owenia fusiformis]|uniref:Fe2OG dioxygenase domain-containing protein n=1 Tax=Owenia fusiformis TaxID=6347 RepID=A0A8S4N3T5_OWEFU|nr:unnamed protein product [Owenia fusiformis]
METQNGDVILQNSEKSQNSMKRNGPLETIDLAAALETPKDAAKVISRALENEGFLYIVNIPDFESAELLKATKWFFNLPLNEKMTLARKAFEPENVNTFRGYNPVIPGGHSYKEAFEIGMFGDFDYDKHKKKTYIDSRPLMRDIAMEGNVWPDYDPQYPKFKDTIIKYCDIYRKTGEQVLQLIALSLGLEKTALDHLFQSNILAMFRLLHYPSRVNFSRSEIPDEAIDGDELITTGAHADSSYITLLATFDNWGLQMQQKGVWIDVPPIKDSLLMNIGALMSELVGGRFRATIHRVVDLGKDRFSAPFFYSPSFDADISKTYDGKDIERPGQYKKYGPWMLKRTSQFKEYSSTDFGVYLEK